VLKGTSKQPKFSGGGWRRNWRPPKASEISKHVGVLLYRGAYRMPYLDLDGKPSILETDYGMRFVHRRIVFSATKKNPDGSPKIEKIIVVGCSAGVAQVENSEGAVLYATGEEECPACDTSSRLRKSSPVSYAQRTHVFNLVLMAHFHKVMKTNPRTQREYTEYEPCTGRGCLKCKDGIEKAFGLNKYWELGSSHADAIADFDLHMLSFRCRCGGQIQYVGFECEHCNRMLRNIDDDPWPVEELDALRESDWECGCGHVGLARQLLSCTSCNEPEPLTLWNTVIRPYRTGEGTSSTLQFGEFRGVTQEELDAVKDLMRPVELDSVAPVFKPAQQIRELGLREDSGDPKPPEEKEKGKEEEAGKEYESYDDIGIGEDDLAF